MKICHIKCKDCRTKGAIDISKYSYGQAYTIPNCPNCNGQNLETFEQ